MVLSKINIFICSFLLCSSVLASDATLEKDIKSIDKKLEGLNIDPSSIKKGDVFSIKVKVLLFEKLTAINNLLKSKSYTGKDGQRDKAKIIVNVAYDFDLHDYDFDDLIDEFEELQLAYGESLYSISYQFIFSYKTWNYKLVLERDNAEDADLLSTEKGPCVGVGIKYQNAFWGADTSICYGLMTATIGEDEDTNINYNQHNVSINALFSQSSVFWKPKKDVAIKFGLPLILRSGSYSNISNTTVTEGNNFSYGLSFGADWSISNHSLNITMGTFHDYPSSYWSFGYVLVL